MRTVWDINTEIEKYEEFMCIAEPDTEAYRTVEKLIDKMKWVLEESE